LSTKEFGCFFCDDKSDKFDGICPTCKKPINIGEELSKQKILNYSPKSVLGRGFFGWTLRMEASYMDFAVKVMPLHRVDENSIGEREARAMASCSPHRNIARFFQTFPAKIYLLDEEIDVLCLVFEFIENAVPLRQIIERKIGPVSKIDIIHILVGIASALQRLHDNNMWHHDLHDDNILVRPVNSESENLAENYESKLIDFGSVRPKLVDAPEPSPDQSDYSYLSKHILGLVSAFEFEHRERMVHIGRVFCRKLRGIAQKIADIDTSRRDYRQLRNELRNTLTETQAEKEYPTFEEMIRNIRVSIRDPFANRDALQLTSQDIALLFRDSLSWQTRLEEKTEPVLVVGPRGCGKTMLLRYLSVASQGRPRNEGDSLYDVSNRLDNLGYFGILVRAGNLKTPFIRSSYRKIETADPEKAEEFCREYINTHFVHETIRALSWLREERLASVSEEDIDTFLGKLQEFLQTDFLDASKRYHANELADLLDIHAIELSNMSPDFDYSPSVLARDDVLIKIADALKSTKWAEQKEIFFLIDDYSPTILPDLAIKAFNLVIFRKSDLVKLKISSEGDGPSLDDTLHRSYKEGRDYVRLNLGEIYFFNNEFVCRQFIGNILQARFDETGVGSLSELKSMLGEHEYTGNFGKYICSQSKPGLAKFNGFDIICRLCSGDVSYIIELLDHVVGGQWGKIKDIKPDQQDTVIKLYAQRQLASLRANSEYGPQLHSFAQNIGRILKQYLIDSCGDNNTDERLRIEIEGDGKLSPESFAFHTLLLKHSVLIPGGSGKSREGLPTKKFFFRRLYAPCFPFSPNRGGCIAITWSEFNQWLKNPSGIKKKKPRNSFSEPKSLGPLFEGMES
jgi:energy-coupling factor transporter ATP-binding protein EcfA2